MSDRKKESKKSEVNKHVVDVGTGAGAEWGLGPLGEQPPALEGGLGGAGAGGPLPHGGEDQLSLRRRGLPGLERGGQQPVEGAALGAGVQQQVVLVDLD